MIPERELSVSGLFSPTHLHITDAKVFDSEEKELVKPPLLYVDAIADGDFIVVAEEHHWLQEVDSRMMFLPSMVRCYSIRNFQYESIVRVMGEPIFAHQDGVAFGIIDRRRGRSTNMGWQVVGLYPSKYGVDMPACEDLVEASVFANHFGPMGGQYPYKDFWAEV